MAKQINWISEADAAKMLLRKEETLRKKVKAGVWPIAYTAVNGRFYQYSEADIQKLLINNSTLVNSWEK